MPRANDPTKTWIAFLGHRDSPTDGVEDYCTFLREALARCGVELKIERLRWTEDGWLTALRHLWHDSANWRGRWVLLQYTAFGWSRYGFPFGVLATIAILRSRGARCAIVFHDGVSNPSHSVVERLRSISQHWVVRQAYRMAEWRIFTIPLDRVGWLTKVRTKAAFVPIGANVPPLDHYDEFATRSGEHIPSVAVFGVTEPPNGQLEIETVAHIMRQVAASREGVRLLVFGRGAEAAEAPLREALQGVPLILDVRGILEAKQASALLTSSDALLFVRGQLSGRRGSALAGVACGLPVVGYIGPETAFPMTEAGLELVPKGDREGLSRALIRVLSDYQYSRELRRRSFGAQEKYFSWEKIARAFVRILGNE
jgi:glycosyltransferase involved in cell wall biosynthesis